MKLDKTILLLPLVICCFGQLLFADTITFKSGRKIRGEIVKKTDRYIVIEIDDLTLKYPRDDIAKIKDYPSKRKRPVIKNLISYKVKKTFTIRPLMDLHTLRFRYPVGLRNLSYQAISTIRTLPKHDALIDDPNNNKVAVFDFPRPRTGKNININISYSIQVQQTDLRLKPEAIPDRYGKLNSKVRAYLKSYKDAKINNKLLKNTARSITKNIKNPYRKGRALYNFITRNFTYEHRPEISGFQNPDQTLRIKKGNCADLSRLFIALARTSGIPAREVDGIVFMPNVSRNKCVTDVGHAWVEIYLPRYGWVPVDPTFGISKGKNYYCFRYEHHIREYYGQTNSKDFGTLFRGASIEVTAREKIASTPIGKSAQIEITLLKTKRVN